MDYARFGTRLWAKYTMPYSGIVTLRRDLLANTMIDALHPESLKNRVAILVLAWVVPPSIV